MSSSSLVSVSSMGEVGTFKASNEASVQELKRLMKVLDNGDYVTEENWSDGEVIISTRDNQTLTESAKET